MSLGASVESCRELIASHIPDFHVCMSGDELTRGMTLVTYNAKISPMLHDFGSNLLPPSLARLARLSKGPALESDAMQPSDQASRENLKNIELLKSAPPSYDGHYSCAVLYQELASRSTPGSQKHLVHLEASCSEYQLAHELKPDAFSPLYNWAVALSEISHVFKMRPPTAPANAPATAPATAPAQAAKGGTKVDEGSNPERALKALRLSAEKYRMAIRREPDNPRLLPQALNNLGLVLHEISQASASNIEARDERMADLLVMFRTSIHILPSFDRSAYNLGTILHSWAGVLSQEISGQYRGIGAISGPQEAGQELKPAREERVRALYADASMLILFALSLQPKKSLYRDSFNLVRPTLPLPFIRAGFLLVCPQARSKGGALIPEIWEKHWMVLDAASLRSAISNTGPQDRGFGMHTSSFIMELQDIESCITCSGDLTIPSSTTALRVGLRGKVGGGVYLVAENEEARDSWIDALTLASYIVQSRGEQALSSLLV